MGIVLFDLLLSFLISFSMTSHGFVSEVVQHRVEDSYIPCYTVLVPPGHQYVPCKTAYGQDSYETCSKDTYQPDNASSSLEVQCIHPSCPERTRAIEVQEKGPKILKCVCDLFKGYCENDIANCHMIPKSCRGKWVYPDCSCKRERPRLETSNTPTTIKGVVFWPVDASRFPIDPKVHTYKPTTDPTMDGSGGTKPGNISDEPNPKVKSGEKSTEKSYTSRTVGRWIGYAVLGCVTILACFVIVYCEGGAIRLKFQSVLKFTRTSNCCTIIPKWMCKTSNRRIDQQKQHHAEPDENRPLYATIEEVERSPAVARGSCVVEIVPVVTSEDEDLHPSPEPDSSQTSVKAIALGLDVTESSVNETGTNFVNEYVDLLDSKSLASYTEATAVRIEEDNTRCTLPVVPNDANLNSITTRSADLRSEVFERENASPFQTPVSISAQNAQVTRAEIHRMPSTNSIIDGNSGINNRENGDRDLFRSESAASVEVNNASVLLVSQQSLSDTRDVTNRSMTNHGSFFTNMAWDGSRQHLQTCNLSRLANTSTFTTVTGRNASVTDASESAVPTNNSICHKENLNRDCQRHVDCTSLVHNHSQSGSDGSEASGPSFEEPVLPLGSNTTRVSCDERRWDECIIIREEDLTEDMKQRIRGNNVMSVRILMGDPSDRVRWQMSPDRIEHRTPVSFAAKGLDCRNNSGSSPPNGAEKRTGKPVGAVVPQRHPAQMQPTERLSPTANFNVDEVSETFDNDYSSFSSGINQDSSTFT